MKLKLPLIFQDGCVLQQGKACTVWGKAEPGTVIEAEIQGKKAETQSDGEGNWSMSLPVLTASCRETLSITAGEEQIVYRNVAIGEVWILGGQSNMEFHMRYDEGFSEELKQAPTDQIRFFDQPEISYEGQDADFDYSDFGFWRSVEPEGLEFFSAVGYYFAKRIEREIHMPVGLVGLNWGGTPSCAWMSRKEVEENGPEWLEDYERELKVKHLGLAGDYFLHPEWNTLTPEEEKKNPILRTAFEKAYRKNPANDRGNIFGDAAADELMYGMSHEKQMEILKMLESQTPPADETVITGPLHQNRPGGLYETMILKAAPYTARGVLWYQGETDSFHPEIYDKMLTGIIKSWRRLWNEELPFYVVQLAPFEQWLQCVGDAFPLLREQQQKVSAAVEKVYLVSTADVGLRYDIHPKKKKPVGERLAYRALEEEYGKGSQPRSPELAGIEWKDQTHVILQFNYAPDGLRSQGNPARGFELEQNGRRTPLEETGAEIIINGDIIRINLPETGSGCKVLYGKKPYFEGNLFNAAGLPVFPFAIKIPDTGCMGFAKDFLWGAASAAYQIEGAWDEDGKAPGIWDALSKGHIRYGDTGKESADHYHHWKEDVALMKKIGLKSYRFSISWPRVIPEKGKINQKGLAFYSNLVTELKNAGIDPVVTLYHWNLPMWAFENGGWENEKTADDFSDFVRVMVDALSDRVRYWITINEPQCFVGAGYLLGLHAPFLHREKKIGEITRNVMLAHGRAVKVIREHAVLMPRIGFASTESGICPVIPDEEHIEQAKRDTYGETPGVFGNLWWMDPIILGRIPDCLKDSITAKDIQEICQPLDFLAVNIYDEKNTNLPSDNINQNLYPGMPRSSADMGITPEVLYWMPKFHYERYHLPLLISENGMANIDFVMEEKKVHDPQRIWFLNHYLANLKKAAGEGVPVIGYQYWSIMDNLEWAEGYGKRFGLIYVDYRTKERILKDSAMHYSEIIKTNGEICG